MLVGNGNNNKNLYRWVLASASASASWVVASASASWVVASPRPRGCGLGLGLVGLGPRNIPGSVYMFSIYTYVNWTLYFCIFVHISFLCWKFKSNCILIRYISVTYIILWLRILLSFLVGLVNPQMETKVEQFVPKNICWNLLIVGWAFNCI